MPKYPWTDLGFALAPNGRRSLGDPGSPTGDGFPIGTAKASDISGLFASGAAQGTFETGTRTAQTQGDEGPISVPAWNTRLVGRRRPLLARGSGRAPSPPRLDRVPLRLLPGRAVAAQASDPQTAIFSISGWTDDLFEAIESFRMFDHLKALNPRWPVEVSVADIGHSRAQNRPPSGSASTSRRGSSCGPTSTAPTQQQTTVSSQPTLCGTANAGSAQRITGRTPAGLSSGSLRVAFTRGASLNQSSGAEDPDGPATDAIAGGLAAPGRPSDGCTQSARSPGQQTTGYTALSAPLAKPRTYAGLGDVTVGYELTGPGATLHARVWDVAPDGTTLLMTRGTYRIDPLARDDADALAGTPDAAAVRQPLAACGRAPDPAGPAGGRRAHLPARRTSRTSSRSRRRR